MTTYDLAEVRNFTDDLDVRMNRRAQEEGTQPTALDDSMRECAVLCREFRDGVRKWGQALFSGSAAFYPEVEGQWLKSGDRLLCKVVRISEDGERVEPRLKRTGR